jgi:hypothetical protein
MKVFLVRFQEGLMLARFEGHDGLIVEMTHLVEPDGNSST